MLHLSQPVGCKQGPNSIEKKSWQKSWQKSWRKSWWSAVKPSSVNRENGCGQVENQIFGLISAPGHLVKCFPISPMSTAISGQVVNVIFWFFPTWLDLAARSVQVEKTPLPPLNSYSISYHQYIHHHGVVMYNFSCPIGTLKILFSKHLEHLIWLMILEKSVTSGEIFSSCMWLSC